MPREWHRNSPAVQQIDDQTVFVEPDILDALVSRCRQDTHSSYLIAQVEVRSTSLNSSPLCQRLHVRDKRIDIFNGRVPGAHEAAPAFADEVVEHPAAIPKSLDEIGGQLHKNRVRLAREKLLYLFDR